MGALDSFWTFKIFVLEGLLCVLLNSFAFDQIPLSTLLVFIFPQFSVSIQIQCKFEWHRWLHAVKYIARKSWKAGVGLVAQVGWFSDWHAEILYWRNKLLYFVWLYVLGCLISYMHKKVGFPSDMQRFCWRNRLLCFGWLYGLETYCTYYFTYVQ